MRIETTRFGMINVKDGSILQMPEGMLGFEHCKRFILLEEQPGAAFKWMQAVDDKDVAFVITNPCDFFPDYEVELTESQAELMELTDPGEAVMFTTVTVGREQGQVTTNLLGPIVINVSTLCARQIVLDDDRYGTKHLIAEDPSAIEILYERIPDSEVSTKLAA